MRAVLRCGILCCTTFALSACGGGAGGSGQNPAGFACRTANAYKIPVAASDYDGDGTVEAFVGSANLPTSPYATVYDLFGATSEWEIQQPAYNSVAATTADMTGDGRTDLVTIAWDGSVYVHDAIMKALVWEGPPLKAIFNDGLKEAVDVLVKDLSGDGLLDIVAVTGSMLVAYERAPDDASYRETTRYEPDKEIIDAALSDTDGDGTAEIVILTRHSIQPEQPTTVERLDDTLQALGTFAYQAFAYALADDPSGRLRGNLLLGIGDPLGGPAWIAAVGALSRVEVWRSPALIGAISPNSLHVVAIEGKTRLSLGTQSGMYLTR